MRPCLLSALRAVLMAAVASAAEKRYKTMGGGKLYHHVTDSKAESNGWDIEKPMYEMSESWRARGHNFGQNFFQPFPKGGSQIIREHGKVPGSSLCGGPLDPEDMPRGIMPDEELADWAIARLGEQHGKPFLLGRRFCPPARSLHGPSSLF